MKGHGAYYACPVCYVKAVQYEKGNTRYWPAYTWTDSPGLLRNDEMEKAIMRTRAHLPMDDDMRFGLKHVSVFRSLPYFNVVYDIPPDFMHSLCQGTVKHMFTLMFTVSIASN